MALTTTNAQISIQDGASAAVNLTAFSQIGFFTPGNQVTFALQSVAGINRAEITLICPKYPGLNGLVYIWTPGNVNGWQVFYLQAFSAFHYLLSGGFSKPALYPPSLLRTLKKLDNLLSRWPRLFGARSLIGLTPSPTNALP